MTKWGTATEYWPKTKVRFGLAQVKIRLGLTTSNVTGTVHS